MKKAYLIITLLSMIAICLNALNALSVYAEYQYWPEYWPERIEGWGTADATVTANSSGEYKVQEIPITLQEAPWRFYFVVNFSWIPYPAWYDLTIYVDVNNPSNKWRHVTGTRYIVYAEENSWEWNTFSYYAIPPTYLIMNRTQYATNVVTIRASWKAIASGWIAFYVSSRAIIDDFNGDRKINIMDVAEIAKNYGKTYDGSVYDPLFKYDFDYNSHVDMFDVEQVGRDFGYEIPP